MSSTPLKPKLANTSYLLPPLAASVVSLDPSGAIGMMDRPRSWSACFFKLSPQEQYFVR